MVGKIKFLSGCLVLFCFIVICMTIAVPEVYSAEKTPMTWYWMSVSTEKSGFPGMPSGAGGSMPGMGSLLGMGGDTGSSGKRLRLEVNSPKGLPSNPEATHDIPPVQNMGPTLPLVTPDTGRTHDGRPGERPDKFEKPKMRMVIYWGCSETVRPGQPYVIDTEKASPAEFGKMFQGRHAVGQQSLSPRPGWAYADWPNKRDGKQVPANSSLAGGHFVHGNYVPDIRFSIDPGHDFMAPVEFTSTKGNPADGFTFQWNSIPTATGYFATAMGHDRNTETMIIWSSSDVREAGWSLMNYLSNEEVRRLVRDKVVMPSSTTQCVIPRGIFKDAQGAMIQFIAYGDELNIVYPQKPKDPIWAVKVRRKSTSMLPLMEASARGSRPGRESAPEREAPPEKKEGVTPGRVLKGILGF